MPLSLQMTTESTLEKLLTAKQAAEILGLSYPQVYRLAKSHALPCVRVGPRRLRFDPPQLRAWLNQGGTGIPSSLKGAE